MKLKVRNFGPIREGYQANDGFMTFPKVTIFCGEQGAGKSTVAKVLSALSWYEKDLFRSKAALGMAKYGIGKVRELLSQQSMGDYFLADTEIEYIGQAVHFSYLNGEFKAEWTEGVDRYLKPQIMYMPAERILAAIIDRVGALQLLPVPLRDMIVDFKRAKDSMAGNYKLPANGYEFKYDKAEDRSWIVNASADGSPKVALTAASSGLQSVLPMLLVSDFLWQQILKRGDSGEALTPDSSQSPEAVLEFQAKLEALAVSSVSETEKIEALTRYLSPNKRFLNIVEEPELNLYPRTQYEVMTHLVKLANARAENKLVVCTHSPFIVNDMVMKAARHDLIKKAEACHDDVALRKLPPKDETLSVDDMVLYQVADGEIEELEKKSGLFSDMNMLNRELSDWNDNFDELLEIEDRLHG